MTALGVALVVFSALAHTAWNLRAKQAVPTAAFFLAANTLGALLLLPVLVATGAIRVLPTRESAPFLLASVGFEALYYASLARAYRAGELSAAYPVAKGLPVLLVGLVSWLYAGSVVRLGFYLPGLIAISLGIFLVSFRAPGGSTGVPRRLPWMWLTFAGIGTTGYTLCDAAAIGKLPRGGEIPAVFLALDYLFLVAILTSLLLCIPWVAGRLGRVPVKAESWGWKDALFVGAGMQGAYGLVLMAMLFLPNPAVVLALRQLSLPMTLVASARLLKERVRPPKWAAIGCIMAGVVAVKWA